MVIGYLSECISRKGRERGYFQMERSKGHWKRPNYSGAFKMLDHQVHFGEGGKEDKSLVDKQGISGKMITRSRKINKGHIK